MKRHKPKTKDIHSKFFLIVNYLHIYFTLKFCFIENTAKKIRKQDLKDRKHEHGQRLIFIQSFIHSSIYSFFSSSSCFSLALISASISGRTLR